MARIMSIVGRIFRKGVWHKHDAHGRLRSTKYKVIRIRSMAARSIIYCLIVIAPQNGRQPRPLSARSRLPWWSVHHTGADGLLLIECLLTNSGAESTSTRDKVKGMSPRRRVRAIELPKAWVVCRYPPGICHTPYFCF